MNWIILLIALVVIAAISFYISTKLDNQWGKEGQSIASILVGLAASFAALIILIVAIINPISVRKEIAVYEQHYAYFQDYVSENSYNDIAITSKKVELNDWLYKAQYSNSTYGGWSWYPDSIQDLEPIE